MENLPEGQTEISEQQAVSPLEKPTGKPMLTGQNKWWRIGSLVTLALVLATAGVFGFYVLKAKKVEEVPQPTRVPTPTLAPIFTPTPDSTADWETYTNAKSGYSMKYPPEFNYKIGEKGEVMVVFDPSQEVLESPAAEDKTLVIITADTNKPVIDKSYYGEPAQVAEETEVTVDGETGLQVVFSKPVAWIQTAVAHGNRSFYFSLQNMQYRSEYNQILSTFRFLGGRAGVDCRTLETLKIENLTQISKVDCQNCEGRWELLSMDLDMTGCNPKTSDAGKTCTDSERCVGMCLGKENMPTSGICSDYKFILGCNLEFLEGKVLMICRD